MNPASIFSRFWEYTYANNLKYEVYEISLILKILYIRGHVDDTFWEKNFCVIAGIQTIDLQFSVLASITN